MHRNQTQWSLRMWGAGAITPSGLKMVHAQFLYLQWHGNGTSYGHTLLCMHQDSSHYLTPCKCSVNNRFSVLSQRMFAMNLLKIIVRVYNLGYRW